MQSFKQFLTEAASTEVSTALETVLGATYEAASQTGATKQKNTLKKLMMDSKNKSKFEKTMSFWKITSKKVTDVTDEEIKNLLIFGNNVVTAIAAAGVTGKGDFKFQNKGKITKEWAKWSGKGTFKYDGEGVIVEVKTTRADVSKTDIILNGKKFSVKNADGAQLMSGKKGESIATVEAATLTSKLDLLVATDIVSSFNKLEAETTEGYYGNMENLKSLWKNKDKELDTILKLARAMEQKKEEWQKDKDKIKEIKGNPEEKKKAQTEFENKWLPKNYEGPGEVTEKGTPLLTKGMTKVLELVKTKEDEKKWIASGKSTMLTEFNKKFMKEVMEKLEDNADTAKTKLSSAFSSNDKFKNAFVYEAATGDQKFGPIEQRAEYMLSWAPKGQIETFKVKAEKVGTAAKPALVIQGYAKAMDLQVNWKSSARSSKDPKKDHMGYNVYQGVRIGIKTAMEEAEKEQLEANEEYEHLSQQLNEGHLAEGAFWDKIKDLAAKFWGKIKEVWNKVVGIFKKVVGYIKDAVEHGARAFSTALGIDMVVTDTLRNKTLKVRI